MILPTTDAETWAKQYGLLIDERPCAKCQQLITATIPFAEGKIRGLRSEEHGCGEEYRLIVFRSMDKQFNTECLALFNQPSSDL